MVGSDAALLASVRAPTTSIADVVGVMKAVEAALGDDDGIKWFTWLYRQVTEEILEDCRRKAWASPDWLVSLDVEFAKLYFQAIERWVADRGATPPAWAAFFARRFAPGVARVQFGLAGMNAHINRDLPLAVVAACRLHGILPRWGSAEHADFVRVNSILDQVEIRAMQRMATGAIRCVCAIIEPLDRIATIAVVSRARSLAWVNAQVFLRLGGWYVGRRTFIGALDAIAARLGAFLLIPTEQFS